MAKYVAERVAERRGLAGQHVLGALDQRRLAAQAMDGLGHLGADRAVTQDQQPAGHRSRSTTATRRR